MTLQPLDLAGLKPPEPQPHGGRPTLLWVTLADCGVDPEYQRPLTWDSRKRIARIAAELDWACFSPLLVARAPGGKYALIDGQHRARAALLVGETEAPALLIDAGGAGQAKAFAAVNGRVTKVSPLALFRAARAAGDLEARALDAAAANAGVRMLTYPRTVGKMQPGDCTAPASMLKILRDRGRPTLERALVAIMASKGDKRGLVNSTHARALALVFRDKPLSFEAIRAAFAHIDLRDAEKVARRDGFEGLYSDLAREVKARLAALARQAGARV